MYMEKAWSQNYAYPNFVSASCAELCVLQIHIIAHKWLSYVINVLSNPKFIYWQNIGSGFESLRSQDLLLTQNVPIRSEILQLHLNYQ